MTDEFSVDQEYPVNNNQDESVEAELPVFQCRTSFLLKNSSSLESATGEGDVLLYQNYLMISPKLGSAFQISYRDIMEVFAGDYRLQMPLVSAETLELFYLGYQYETFCRNLFLLRNELLIRDLLMNEAPKFHGVRGEVQWHPQGSTESRGGPSEIRVYETALVILPEIGEPLRVPFAEIDSVKNENYALTIMTEDESVLSLSMLGKSLDPLTFNISQAMAALVARTQSCLKDLVPGLDPATLRRLAGMMREGRAIRRLDADTIDASCWDALLASIERRNNMDGYRFLSIISRQSRIGLGMKRGLMGEMTGDYIWFLLPFYNPDTAKPGNAVALEAVSSEGTSMATYFFRIMGRAEYADVKTWDELDRSADCFIKTINRCLLAINFRREPIYLTDRQLKEPKFIRYRTALQKIPALKILRDRYIGRIVHSSKEQWEKDVMELLTFNVQNTDDQARQ